MSKEESIEEEHSNKVKAAIEEFSLLKSSLFRGDWVDSNKLWDTQTYIDKLAEDAQTHQNDRLVSFLAEQTKELEEIRERLHQLKKKRVAEVEKHVELTRGRVQKLIEEGQKDYLDPTVRSWLDKIEQNLSDPTEQITVFIRDEETFGVFEESPRIRYGREPGCRRGKELFFCIQPSFILVSDSGDDMRNEEYTDCASAVEAAMGPPESLFTRVDASIFLAYDWNITPDKRGDVNFGDYVGKMVKDWPAMKERSLKGPFTKPQLTAILHKLWSFLQQKKKARTE